jgi:hypothetical protein
MKASKLGIYKTQNPAALLNKRLNGIFFTFGLRLAEVFKNNGEQWLMDEHIDLIPSVPLLLSNNGYCNLSFNSMAKKIRP